MQTFFHGPAAPVLCPLLLLATTVAPAAHAERLAVRVDAIVDHVHDPQGRLAGTVRAGDRMQGLYVYDTAAPDAFPNTPWNGGYVFQAAGLGIAVSVNGLRFRTDPAATDVIADVHHVPTGPASQLHSGLLISSNHNLFDVSVPDPRPEWGNTLDVLFSEYSGTALPSDALPAGVPVLPAWSNRQLLVSSSNADDSERFEIVGRIVRAWRCAPQKQCRLEAFGPSLPSPLPQALPSPAARR